MKKAKFYRMMKNEKKAILYGKIERKKRNYIERLKEKRRNYAERMKGNR